MTQTQRLPFSLEFDRLTRTWSVVASNGEPLQTGMTNEAARVLLKKSNAPAIAALQLRQVKFLPRWKR